MLVILTLVGCSQKADVAVISPQIEMLTNPQGIDVIYPRFSWKIECAVMR